MALRAIGSTVTDTNWAQNVPPSVALDGQIGAMLSAARGDHTHAARIQRFIQNTDSNGQCICVFARPFPTKPVVVAVFEESANNQPIILKNLSYQTDGNGNYTGVTVQAYRAQTLPVSLTLITQLIGFNIFAGTAPVGIPLAIFAGEATQ